MANLKATLGAANRTHAVACAVALGVITLPDPNRAAVGPPTGPHPRHEPDPIAQVVWPT